MVVDLGLQKNISSLYLEGGSELDLEEWGRKQKEEKR